MIVTVTRNSIIGQEFNLIQMRKMKRKKFKIKPLLRRISRRRINMRIHWLMAECH